MNKAIIVGESGSPTADLLPYFQAHFLKEDKFLVPCGKLSQMESISRKEKRYPTDSDAIIKTLVQEGSSPYLITWAILGGKEFMPQKPVSNLDFLTASHQGITMQSIVNLAGIMDIPMKAMASLLNVSYKTLGRKRKSDVLDNLASSLSIEIANTIANGLAVFEDRDKLNRWLNKENRALKNKKPIELLNTPTGIKMVNAVLTRIEEGIYS